MLALDQPAQVTASQTWNARFRSKPVVSGPQQMPAHSKEILHDAVHGREALHVSGRLEAPHLPFALPRRLMGDFGSIVRVLLGGVDYGRDHARRDAA